MGQLMSENYIQVIANDQAGVLRTVIAPLAEHPVSSVILDFSNHLTDNFAIDKKILHRELIIGRLAFCAAELAINFC